MKLKLTQPGYEYMNGYLGITEFKDGVSINDIAPRDARNIAISIGCEYEDGSSPNPAQNLLDGMHDKAGEAKEISFAPPPPKFTRAELEEMADKGGIKALRAVATPLGIKGTSIAELIAELLGESEPAAPAAPEAPEAAEVVAPEAAEPEEAPAEEVVAAEGEGEADAAESTEGEAAPAAAGEEEVAVDQEEKAE